MRLTCSFEFAHVAPPVHLRLLSVLSQYFLGISRARSLDARSLRPMSWHLVYEIRLDQTYVWPTWAIRGGRQVNTRIQSRIQAEVNTFGIRTYSGARGGSSEQG